MPSAYTGKEIKPIKFSGKKKGTLVCGVYICSPAGIDCVCIVVPEIHETRST